MNKYLTGLGIGAALAAGFLATAPAFAATSGEHENSSSMLGLTITTQGSNYVFTVTGIQSRDANSTILFRSLTKTQWNAFSSNDDGGSIFPGDPYTGSASTAPD